MADNELDVGSGVDGPTATPKGNKLKLIVMMVVALMFLGGGAATYFLFFNHHGEQSHAEMVPEQKPPVFVEVPDMLVNLSAAPGERVQYLRVKVVLELKDDRQAEAIKPSMPRVTDIFQTYLRELRTGDLSGSAGLFRLKEELTRRVNLAVAPIPVVAVLFKEIVVQ
jgi:flagellar FliL protein